MGCTRHIISLNIKSKFLDDKFILHVIIANAFVIFAGGFNLNQFFHSVLFAFDHIFTLIFTVELIIKLKTYGKSYFSSPWNIFDFVIIILSLPSLLEIFSYFGFSGFEFIQIFRVFRVVKFFRFIKFVPNVENLVLGIRKALRASVFVILGFIIYIFVIGIISQHLFKEYSPKFYGNPGLAIYSTFKLFTLEGWYEIPDSITEDLSEVGAFFTTVYFIFIVVSGGIVGLSILNSVFVDALVSDNNDGLEQRIEKLEKKIDILLDYSQNIKS